MTSFVGPCSLIQSDFRSGDYGNFEAVLHNGGQLQHLYGAVTDRSVEWHPGQVLPAVFSGPASIIQSDFGAGDHKNFEVVVPMGAELVHWWHDNSDVSLPWQRGQVITGGVTGPGCIIQSDFGAGDHKNFEVVVPVGQRLRHFFHDNSSVALPWTPAQVVTRASMYVFFTTDRIEDPLGDPNSMGRSVLARTEDGGIKFGSPIYDFSTGKFINLSLQVVTNGDFPGLPDQDGQGLLVWGSGRYRQSNVYLAYVRLDRLADRSAFWYFSGTLPENQRPRWAKDEAEARPLFLSGTVGELCVRWNPFLARFILVYNGANPLYIIEHQSIQPWGPWTGGQNVFDQDQALGVFMHKAGSNDGLADPDDSDGGASYGPYLISRYTTPSDDGSTTMYFVLSVHNPYNTMLMSMITRAREIPGG